MKFRFDILKLLDDNIIIFHQLISENFFLRTCKNIKIHGTAQCIYLKSYILINIGK